MADSTTNATTSTQGTPVQMSTSLTSSTIVPAPNPLMEPKSWMEFGAFILMVCAVFALVEKRAEKRRKEDQDYHKLSHDALNKDISDLHHDIKNNSTTIKALEQFRSNDVDRITRLESAMESLKEGQHRMETNMKDNHKETLAAIDKWAIQFSDSIREIRQVAPKP